MFSELALVFYSVVYIPQFLLIWKEKSSNGVSLLTMLLWTQADFISLTASILLQLDKSILIIDWYHCFVSVSMTIFCLYFNNDKQKPWYFVCFFNLLFCCTFQLVNYKNENLGEILAWVTSIIYIVGRFPQIYKNWKLGSTKGLSIWMFIFTMLGNGFYLFSIFEQSNISIYIPWITLILISFILDSVVLIQHQYNNNSIESSDETFGLDSISILSDSNSTETDTL